MTITIAEQLKQWTQDLDLKRVTFKPFSGLM